MTATIGKTVDGLPVRASVIGVQKRYMNPPSNMYVQANRYVSGEPMPQYITGDFSERTLQSLITNVLPYARIHGVPGPDEMPPGLSSPLTPLERQWLTDMLAAEATP
ncbi:hypothetical protein QTI24_26655 [Variovorax sp. J22P240]|uniref:hypothetical protein n=1 Tax=Variovorax sp. J22P240 TaxID=3053514 RepID=UPI00257689F0|nr:hypothetical protein [Variovorax sp. J22P240]MDM0002214.1 hypothetical protein [Variovorax sp. J22P240]